MRSFLGREGEEGSSSDDLKEAHRVGQLCLIYKLNCLDLAHALENICCHDSMKTHSRPICLCSMGVRYKPTWQYDGLIVHNNCCV